MKGEIRHFLLRRRRSLQAQKSQPPKGGLQKETRRNHNHQRGGLQDKNGQMQKEMDRQTDTRKLMKRE